MQRTLAITAVLIAALAACGTPPASPPAAPVTAPAPVAPGPTATPAPAPGPLPAPARQTLAAEQRRLTELFRGTPVAFAMQADGALRVTVPLQFCFDRAAAVVKPPLAAVLDRLAKSQRDQGTRLRVAAAPDPGKGAGAGAGGSAAALALALARRLADTARDYLEAQGIKANRLTTMSLAQVAGAGVEILVLEAAQH